MYKQSNKSQKALELGRLLVGLIGKGSKQYNKLSPMARKRLAWGAAGAGYGEAMNALTPGTEGKNLLDDYMLDVSDKEVHPTTRLWGDALGALTWAGSGPKLRRKPISSALGMATIPGWGIVGGRSRKGFADAAGWFAKNKDKLSESTANVASAAKYTGDISKFLQDVSTSTYMQDADPGTVIADQLLREVKKRGPRALKNITEEHPEINEFITKAIPAVQAVGDVAGSVSKGDTATKETVNKAIMEALETVREKGPSVFEEVTAKNPAWNELAGKLTKSTEGLAAAGGQIAAGGDPVETLLSPLLKTPAKALGGMGLGTVGGAALAKLLLGAPVLGLKDTDGDGRISAEEQDEWYKSRRKSERRRNLLTTLAAVLGGQAGLAVASPETFNRSMDVYKSLGKGLISAPEFYSNIIRGKK